MNKKGTEWLLTIIIAFGIIAIGAAILIWIFTSGAGKSRTFFEAQFESTGDIDRDNSANFEDVCKCQAGPRTNKGCPSGIDPDQASIKDQYKGCPQEYCDGFMVKGCPDNPHSV